MLSLCEFLDTTCSAPRACQRKIYPASLSHLSLSLSLCTDWLERVPARHRPSSCRTGLARRAPLATDAALSFSELCGGHSVLPLRPGPVAAKLPSPGLPARLGEPNWHSPFFSFVCSRFSAPPPPKKRHDRRLVAIGKRTCQPQRSQLAHCIAGACSWAGACSSILSPAILRIPLNEQAELRAAFWEACTGGIKKNAIRHVVCSQQPPTGNVLPASRPLLVSSPVRLQHDNPCDLCRFDGPPSAHR